MKDNMPLYKTLSLLSHPVAFIALGLYAVNIFVLQQVSPNWLTGKIGDFAWVFLAPFALAAILAWLLPKRYSRHAFTYAVIGTVLFFVLVKATSVNTSFVSSLEKLTGRPISVARDRSDLLALTVIPAAIWLWHCPQYKAGTRYPAGIIVMSILALLTLADSAAPNLGITSIKFDNDAITACGGYYENYQSLDNGRTWQPSEVKCEMMINSPHFGEVVQDPKNENIQYRFKPGLIERSADGGEHWQIDYQWAVHSEAERLYYVARKKAWSMSLQTPFNATIQPQTGDVFLAMGHEGILKRTAGAQPQYTWITVGEYKKIDFSKGELLFHLLYGEWMLALAAGAAGIILLDIKSYPGKLKKALLILCLIGMAGCALIFPPAPSLAGPYLGPLVQLGLFILFLIMLSLTVNALVNAGRRPQRYFIACLFGSLAVTVITIVPYALWASNIIPLYKNAAFSAVILAVLSIIGFHFFARRWMAVSLPRP